MVCDSMDNYSGRFSKLIVSLGAVLQGVEGSFFGVGLFSYQCIQVKLASLKIWLTYITIIGKILDENIYNNHAEAPLENTWSYRQAGPR